MKDVQVDSVIQTDPDEKSKTSVFMVGDNMIKKVDRYLLISSLKQ